MNFFNKNKNNSLSIRPTCTSCCPYDTKNLFHPKLNDFSTIKENETDTCCLNKLQVDCRIQCYKKKKRRNYEQNNKRYDSLQSIKRSFSSSSQLNSHEKRKKLDSFTKPNSHDIHDYDLNTQTSSSSISTLSNTNQSQITEQTFSSIESELKHKSANAQQQQEYKRSQTRLQIQDLKTSIDNLKEVILQEKTPQSSISFFDKFRHFFNLFKSSSKPTKDLINEECSQILKYNHLTKQNLLSIYNLFDKNETIFLNWLRTIMPEHMLPLLLNYVKYFDSISTDNE